MPSSADNPPTTGEKWWCPRHLVVTIEGPRHPRGEVVVAKPFARLGRDQRSEIELADAGVLPCQVYLHATNEGVYCTGLAAGSRNGWLLPSTTLEIGPFRVRACLGGAGEMGGAGEIGLSGSPDPQSKGSAGPRVPRIRMFTDKSRTSHADILLQRQLTLIGRQMPATWRIKHPTISRAHGAVVWDGTELWLIDFFSSNGTRLGESRCDAGPVRTGQEFRLGTVTCCYLDVQPAVATGEQVGATDSSDSGSTRLPPFVGAEGRAEDAAREHRLDTPQLQDEHLSPPHVPGGGVGRGAPGSRPDLAPSEGPLSDAAAPAALVETRPLTGDTKFVDRPVRSQEDRLAAVEVELAAQREVAAARAARIDSELAMLRQELERLEAALRHQRESDRDYRAQVAELRERVLRELAQIGEQTQLVRQACDVRPWEGGLARLADDTVRRCAELERQVQEGLRLASDKLAAVEGTMIAKIAELRSRQDRQREDRFAGLGDDSESVLSVELVKEEWPAPEEDQPGDVRTAGSGPVADTSNTKEWPSSEEAGLRRSPPPRNLVEDGSSQWLLGDEFTHRLVDFQAKRERSAWQRRLLWTGAALASALVIVLAASLLRFWLNPDRAAGRGDAPAQQEEKSKAVEQGAG
jgi:hypothetical protein